MARKLGSCKISISTSTKYYIPNHRRIVGMQNAIEIFREKAEIKQENLLKQKNLVEGILDKEKKKEDLFLEEAAKDFDKQDFGKNL
jgi:hypothetical protein